MPLTACLALDQVLLNAYHAQQITTFLETLIVVFKLVIRGLMKLFVKIIVKIILEVNVYHVKVVFSSKLTFQGPY